MAKKQAPKFKGSNQFKDTQEFLSQFGGGVLLEDYKEIDPEMWIHTGNYLYNAHISGSMMKGVPSNRIITIAGDPKTGKSFLLFNIMHFLQEKGYHIYFFETEGAPDKERLKNQLIDMNKVTIPPEPVETVDDIIIPLTRMTEQMKKDKKAGHEIPRVAVFIDSLTALNSQKQYDDAMKGVAKQDMGTVAKDLKRLFNMMAARCGYLQIPTICTAHVYEKDMGNFRKRVPTGGNAAIFLSSVISMLKKTDERDDDRQRTGIIVTSEIVESRFSKPKDVTFYLAFQKGMNPYFGLQEYLSWENCGIARGKMVDFVDLAGEMISKKQLQKASFDTKKITKSDFKKHLSKAKLEAIDAYLMHHKENGWITEDEDGNYIFTEKCKKLHYDSNGKYKPIESDKKVHFPNPSSTNWIARHLDEAFPTQVMFRPKVFTKEVLEELDKNVIIPMFEFRKEELDESIAAQEEKDAAAKLDDFFEAGEKES